MHVEFPECNVVIRVLSWRIKIILLCFQFLLIQVSLILIQTKTNQHQLLLSLSLPKAPGLDKLPATLVKLAAPCIAKPLAKIFNKLLLTGIFPNDWKVAKVIPVYKSGTKSNMDNYRPISII